ncbi:hypothetical protein DMH26_30715 [Streptomyces sp. WAC 05379]|uniref:hypothetical protein n=1 Tax=Streptomyces TaxID=1883 RepID=UPI000D3880DD|nr:MULTISPECIES: hypothetical protein [Streptomyces]MBT1091783.1 hypothetical protein [Streptomyces sp. Tu102]RSN88937.1 hypothetical protein DMH26_30715 [Streptomyces sp. WAC 05379]
MSQQYPQQPGYGPPQQPTQPGYGYPQQPGWGGPPPQPPKKRSIGKILGITGAVLVGLIVIGAIAGGGGDDSTDKSNKDKAVAATSDKPKAAEEPAAEEQAAEEPAKEEPAADKSQAEQFKACVTKSGTDSEKAAVGHVTKVTGTDKTNDILDAAEVFTDYKGGFLSENAGDAKLIASAFASCYESKNGLVTIYGSDGDMIANGNY